MAHQGSQPTTPRLFSVRQRLNSVNSPFISPLRIVHSPLNHTDTLFDFHLKNQNFQLEPSNPIQDEEEDDQMSYPESEPQKEEPFDITTIEIDENNILDIILKKSNIKDAQLNAILNKLNEKGNSFIAQLFQYLIKKFKKLRKTKQEMIKYSVRKAFRFISDQLKKEMPNYAVDSNQYLQFYFNKYQQEEAITVPFKKDSEEKTINSAFLKKIFTLNKFVSDYKIFLRTFKKEYQKDNDKKVNAMKDILKQCFKTKCMKGLQNFKRLPWTTQILSKLDQFSKGLLQFVPHRKSESKVQTIVKNDDFLDDFNQRWVEKPKRQQEYHSKQETKHKTKNIIVLTPSIQPMNSPVFPDFE